MQMTSVMLLLAKLCVGSLWAEFLTIAMGFKYINVHKMDVNTKMLFVPDFIAVFMIINTNNSLFN